MSHKMRGLADEIVEALSGAGSRMGKSLKGKSDAQATSVRAIAQAVRRRDLEMGADVPGSGTHRKAGADGRKGPVEPLDVDTYAGNRRRAEVGDHLEHDHVPSAAAIIKAKEHELGRPLLPHEERDIFNNGTTLELPKDVHRDSRTYGGRNTPDQIKIDAGDLKRAAELDYADRRQLLVGKGFSPEAIDEAIQKMRDMNGSRGIR